mgnify:FL=1
MSKILARSPYWINATATDLIYAIFELWIFEGASNFSRPTDPSYTIKSSVTDSPDNVYLDISDLVKGFIDVNYGGNNYDNGLVWVHYRITTATQSSVSTGNIQGGNYAVNGYSYYTEGYNATSLSGCLLSSDIIYKLEDNDVSIPVDLILLESVSFFNGSELVHSYAPTSTPVNNDGIINYIGLDNYDNFQQRIYSQGGTFETNECIDSFLDEYEIYPITKVVVSSLDSSVPLRTIVVENIEECKYTPYKIIFRNKLGAKEELWFFKSSRLSMEVQREKYQGNTIKDYRTGDLSRHRNVDFYTASKETLTINSGFVPEEFNEVFKQLMLSEQVWIEYKQQILPINVSNQTIDYKTKLNNKLINYTIDVEFSFNTTNNVR